MFLQTMFLQTIFMVDMKLHETMRTVQEGSSISDAGYAGAE
jgi:hypothetical protein